MLQSLVQQAAAINAAFSEPAIKKVKDVCLALWGLNKQNKAEEPVSILADLKTTIISKESSPSISMILSVLKSCKINFRFHAAMKILNHPCFYKLNLPSSMYQCTNKMMLEK